MKVRESRLTHEERERIVLVDLEASFPRFTGRPMLWSKVAEGKDPPDFVAHTESALIGLELIEWLDGQQMGEAILRERRRAQILGLLGDSWENEYRPQNFRGAVIEICGERLARSDEATLRKEFFACAAEVDREWFDNAERIGNTYYQAEFPGRPMIAKYVSTIRYMGGESRGSCWIDTDSDGGAFDPNEVVRTLERALDKKLNLYNTAEQKSHLAAQRLTESCLLVHGGFNAAVYNTSAGHLSLEEIAQRGVAYYAAHPQRQTFDRVWFFNSIDGVQEINELFGFPPGAGYVRWLAQLWPKLRIDPGSFDRFSSEFRPLNL